jgi:shikimate dehydrogenase
VLGRPIGHSLSPVLHRAAYRALGLNWTYEAIDCGVAELPHLLADRSDWAGFSCTMPLKHAAFELADAIRPGAAAVGAANTLLPTDNGWDADNTDAPGLAAALREAGLRRPETAAVLGAGGTAQAALAAVAELGATGCVLVVRDPARATAARATADRIGLPVSVARLDAAEPALAAPLVISTLPPGAADVLAARAWAPEQVIVDVVYQGWPTRLAAAAAATGCSVVSGTDLLLHQAALQVQLMTGRVAPLAAMRAALTQAMQNS